MLDSEARSLEPDHRTLARETILVSSDPPKVAGASPLQTVPGASRSEDADTDLTNLIDALRRAIRLQGRAVATEETCVYWNRRFIRFCLLVLKTEMALNRRTRRQRSINQLH